jgi:hypothetical protein
MPYITQDDRKHYTGSLDDLTDDIEEMGPVSGHVTYILYMIVARWFKKQPSYSTICKIRGCLIGTLAEFDRRIAAPYEDKKIKENGDVDLSYPLLEELRCDAGCIACAALPGTFHNEDEFGRFVVSDDIDNRGGA